jgi:topoisomerase IA-like protein
MIDKGFTKDMENKLDDISNGELEKQNMLHEFYTLFKTELTNAEKKVIDSKSKDTFNAYKSKYEPINLGKNKNNEEVSIHNGKFGYYIKIGDKNKKLPAKYVSKVKDLTIDDINSMVFYPFKLKSINKKDVTLNSGKYGLYIRYNNKNYKIDKKIYSKFENHTFSNEDIDNIVL